MTTFPIRKTTRLGEITKRIGTDRKRRNPRTRPLAAPEVKVHVGGVLLSGRI